MSNRQTEIIPALDLIDAKVVRLYQGDYQQQTSYTVDPLQQLLAYENAGATRIHLVDLTGAKQPEKRQAPLLASLAAQSKIPLQVGGGVRNEETVAEFLALGIKRVVIGSLAIQNPKLVKSWFLKYGASALVLALDVNLSPIGEKLIAINGWQENSNQNIEYILNTYLEVGLKHVLCTDIAKDGTLSGSNLALYQELALAYPQIAWQASGGIGTLDDVKQIKQTHVSGIIIGKALLEEKFSLEEAITC